MVVRQGTKIPFFNLSRQIESMREELDTAFAQILGAGSFVLGEWVEKFERRAADFIGVDHAVGVASGTDALVLSYQALGFGHGDGVITTPFTFFATIGSMLRVGARPFFVDIDEASFNINPDSIREFLEGECRRENSGCIHISTGIPIVGIVPVHLFGQMAPMNSIVELADEYRLAIVEDAAQALGAWQRTGDKKRMAGAVGSVAAFSFYPTKNLGAFGDGGLVTTSDAKISEKVKMLRVHGFESEDIVRLPGTCSRLDAMQAAFLSVKLASLEKWNKRRAQIAQRYTELISGKPWASEIVCPARMKDNRHIWHQFVIRVRNRDKLECHLKNRGIGTKVYYRKPLHLQPVIASLGYSEGNFPEAERASRETLALPIWPELTDEEVEEVVETIGLFYNSGGR